MAGPTPIRALIHAATMVAAGVYVVARLLPAVPAAPVDAGRAGRHRRDHDARRGARRARRRTTSSGCWPGRRSASSAYMAGALAVGVRGRGVFHLLTHAAFKALLFLAAGSVIHAVGTNLMPRHGRAARGRCRSRSSTMTIGLRRAGRRAAARRLLLQGGGPRRGRGAALHDGAGRVLGGLAGAASSACVTVAVTAAYATRLWLHDLLRRRRAATRPRRTSRRRLMRVAAGRARRPGGRCSACSGSRLGLAADLAGRRSAGGDAARSALVTSRAVVAARRGRRRRGPGRAGGAAPAADPLRLGRPRPVLAARVLRRRGLRPAWSSGRCGARRPARCAGPTTTSSTPACAAPGRRDAARSACCAAPRPATSQTLPHRRCSPASLLLASSRRGGAAR